MKVGYKSENPKETKADLVVIARSETGKNALFDLMDKRLKGALSKIAAMEKFKGKVGSAFIWQGESKGRIFRLMVVGTGKEDAGSNPWRRAIGKCMSYAVQHSIESIAVFFDSTENEIDLNRTKWMLEALLLGAYRFEKYKKKDDRSAIPKSATVSVCPEPQNLRMFKNAARRSQDNSAGVILSRDLTNEPANFLGPSALARRAEEIASASGLECKVFDEQDLIEMGANLILAVGSGAAEKPHLLHLIYKPAREKKGTVALVGKGITFDSGGLCIKPGKSMATMKTDMAGAAVVLGVMSVLKSLSIPTEVHGIIPVAENAVSSSSVRPGDIVKSMAGLTVEIENTDAEGRLILADALTYAAKIKPDAVIDLATLTGSCAVALGLKTAGLFSNSDLLSTAYLNAAEKAGESCWRLPLTEDLKTELKSRVADMKNTGGRFGGAILGALFLEQFVGSTPWVHLDIAGPSRLEKSTDLCPAGGTGFGVLTTLEFLAAFPGMIMTLCV